MLFNAYNYVFFTKKFHCFHTFLYIEHYLLFTFSHFTFCDFVKYPKNPRYIAKFIITK